MVASVWLHVSPSCVTGFVRRVYLSLPWGRFHRRENTNRRAPLEFCPTPHGLFGSQYWADALRDARIPHAGVAHRLPNDWTEDDCGHRPGAWRVRCGIRDFGCVLGRVDVAAVLPHQLGRIDLADCGR